MGKEGIEGKVDREGKRRGEKKWKTRKGNEWGREERVR